MQLCGWCWQAGSADYSRQQFGSVQHVNTNPASVCGSSDCLHLPVSVQTLLSVIIVQDGFVNRLYLAQCCLMPIELERL